MSPEKQRGGSLHELVATHRQTLVERWAKRVGQELQGPPARAELIDSPRQFLSELVATLRVAHGLKATRPPLEETSTASDHGAHRFVQGFNVAQVIREYAVLGDCIADLADEYGIDVTAQEQRALASALYGAAAKAVGEYVHQKEEEITAQNAKHLGFLAHELRNPLTSAQLAVDLMRLRQDRVPQALSVLQATLGTLRGLVDDALLSARLQGLGAGYALRLEHVPLADIIGEVHREVVADAENRGVVLRFVTESPVTNVDRRLVRSALSNVIRNAIKFTPRGGEVSLSTQSLGTTARIVVDDACGGTMNVGANTSMFDVFVQGGRDRTGFGLGLAIAREAMRAHGGDIDCENCVGTGCRFTLTLPGAIVDSR